ncbi:hypothetical protein GUJ93_ZPchr0106g33684 [Zizania palustris]|uniref:MADS-box domain-containing protein n=1 Tax=Zizania palustris TaxID=103762 RepID=A0A8J5QUJ7_ZIZPA|nr:hypothetical protein GUJ93_ZPchr0106g33684 [Zizania palustris]
MLVHMELITNESTRKKTLKRRQAGLLKKTKELSTLCSIPACVVVYNTDDDEANLAAWPSIPEAKAILTKVMDMPEADRPRRMLDPEGFLQQQITKLRRRIDTLKFERHHHMIANIIFELATGHRKNMDDLSLEVLNDVKLEVRRRLKVVRECITKHRAQGEASSSMVMVPEATVKPPPLGFDLNEAAPFDDAPARE